MDPARNSGEGLSVVVRAGRRSGGHGEVRLLAGVNVKWGPDAAASPSGSRKRTEAEAVSKGRRLPVKGEGRKGRKG